MLLPLFPLAGLVIWILNQPAHAVTLEIPIVVQLA